MRPCLYLLCCIVIAMAIFLPIAFTQDLFNGVSSRVISPNDHKLLVGTAADLFHLSLAPWWRRTGGGASGRES